jgi:hypothetical protein
VFSPAAAAGASSAHGTPAASSAGGAGGVLSSPGLPLPAPAVPATQLIVAATPGGPVQLTAAASRLLGDVERLISATQQSGGARVRALAAAVQRHPAGTGARPRCAARPATHLTREHTHTPTTKHTRAPQVTVIKQGYLTKQSGGHKPKDGKGGDAKAASGSSSKGRGDWKRRFFVLDSTGMYYYYSHKVGVRPCVVASGMLLRGGGSLPSLLSGALGSAQRTLHAHRTRTRSRPTAAPPLAAWWGAWAAACLA